MRRLSWLLFNFSTPVAHFPHAQGCDCAQWSASAPEPYECSRPDLAARTLPRAPPGPGYGIARRALDMLS
jgi:hypothetical protein